MTTRAAARTVAGAGDCARAAAPGHRLVGLPEFADARGALAVIEAGREVGFLPRRVYFAFSSSSNSCSAATQSEVSSPWIPSIRRRSPIK